jgi:predicted permease
MLGVRPVIGHFSTEEELDKQSVGPVAISHEFWQRHFARDRGVLGKTILVDNHEAIVMAVLPPRFDLFGTGPADVTELFSVHDTGQEVTDRWLAGFGRLKRGRTIGQAQASMDILARRLQQIYPNTNKGLGIKLQRLRDSLFGWSREILYPLFAAVGFVLLIACANVANLLLARASARRKEIGIRAALGADRSRLIRQLLTESVVLSLTGGALGLLLSTWGIKIFVAFAPNWLPNVRTIGIDARVLAFTFVIAIATGLMFGLAPALRASKEELNVALKEGGRSSGARSRRGAQSTLVVLEVAMGLVLLVSAGLMVNTMVRELHADPGFHSDRLLTLEVRLFGRKYFDNSQADKTGLDLVTPQVRIFSKQVLDRVQALPGVQSAALIDWLPMLENAEREGAGFTIAGQTVTTRGEHPHAWFSAISPNYFQVMQIPLRKGRELTEQDSESAPWVVVINEAMARKYWPDRSPIGQLVKFDTDADPAEERPREIVGVAGNVRQFRLGMDSEPEIYAPYSQQAQHCTSAATETRLHKSLVLRTNFESPGLVESVRKTVADLDKNSPVFGFKSVNQTISDSTNGERFYTQLLGGFAAVALLLAAIGIYGVISYSVSERTHEMGLRLALGAQTGQVLQQVLKEGLLLALVGVAIGLAGSFGATPLLSSFLYGVHPHDPLTLVLVAALLIAITLLASYMPARRAMKVDPMVTLRHE